MFMKFREKEIRKEMTEWFFFVLMAVVVGFFLMLSYFGEISRAETFEQERLGTLTDVIANDIAGNLVTTNKALNGVIEDYFSIHTTHKNQADISQRLYALEEAMLGVRNMVVISAAGVTTSASHPELVGQSFEREAYFRTARDHPEKNMLYVTPPFMSLKNDLVINVAKTIRNSDGSFGGVVMASLDPEFFMGMFRSVIYAPDVWGMVIHGDGQLLLNFPVADGINGGDMNLPGTFFTRHLESKQSSSLLTGPGRLTHEERLIAMVTIKPVALNMDTAIVVGLSRKLSAIDEPIRHLLVNYGLFYALLLLVCAAWLYWTQIKRMHIESLRARLENERG
jgi:hypothetical protein